MSVRSQHVKNGTSAGGGVSGIVRPQAGNEGFITVKKEERKKERKKETVSRQICQDYKCIKGVRLSPRLHVHDHAYTQHEWNIC